MAATATLARWPHLAAGISRAQGLHSAPFPPPTFGHSSPSFTAPSASSTLGGWKRSSAGRGKGLAVGSLLLWLLPSAADPHNPPINRRSQARVAVREQQLSPFSPRLFPLSDSPPSPAITTPPEEDRLEDSPPGEFCLPLVNACKRKRAALHFLQDHQERPPESRDDPRTFTQLN